MPVNTQETLPLTCYNCMALRPPGDSDNGITGSYRRWRYTGDGGPGYVDHDAYLCAQCCIDLVQNCESCCESFMVHTHRDNSALEQLLGVSSEIFRTDDMHEWLCGDCSYWCECGNSYSTESAMLECCGQDREEVWLHNYGYRPYNMRFHRLVSPTLHMSDSEAVPGVLYMGMEIEVEKCRHLLQEFYDIAREDMHNPSRIYVKSDGSLSTAGAEFVTMPMTLDAIKLLFPWHAFTWLQEKGARAWAYNNCGMHIHVSRSAFTPSHMYRFLRWQLENSNTCIKFAGRDSNWSRWDNNAMLEMKESTAKYSKQSTYLDRYSALNVGPRDTVELRYFKSNILMKGILRNVEWVDAIYNYTRNIPFFSIRHRDGFHIDGFREFLENNATKYENALNHLNLVMSAGADDDSMETVIDIVEEGLF